MKMEDKNLKEEIIEDSINFCLEAVKLSNKKLFFNIGMDRGSSIDVVYTRPETPVFLEKIGVISSMKKINGEYSSLYERNTKGAYTILFNFEAAEQWLDETLNTRAKSIIGGEDLIVNFDPIQSEILVNNTKIAIPRDTNQYYLCKTILNHKNKHKIWNWDEIFDNWGDSERIKDGKKASMVIYTSAKEINKKVAINGYKDFFAITTKTVQLNSKFI